jgi:hypothetical protein
MAMTAGQEWRDGALSRAIRGAAERAVAGSVRAGAIRYERAFHLPRLIRAVPSEFAGTDAAATRWIVSRLERAIAAERRRGRSGHWTYDINRHIALAQALKAETARLRREEEKEGPPPVG